MSVSYPLTLPTGTYPNSNPFSFRSYQMGIEKATSTKDSPFSLKRKVFQNSGARWRLALTYPPLSRYQAKELEGFLHALEGEVGTFWFGDPMMSTPAGIATGTPVLSGSHAAGLSSVSITGFTTSTSNIVRRGDHFQLGDNLHVFLNDANSDGSGNVTVDISPRLRVTHSNGTSVVLNNAKTKFRLEGNFVRWSREVDKTTEITIEAVEAV